MKGEEEVRKVIAAREELDSDVRAAHKTIMEIRNYEGAVGIAVAKYQRVVDERDEYEAEHGDTVDYLYAERNAVQEHIYMLERAMDYTYDQRQTEDDQREIDKNLLRLTRELIVVKRYLGWLGGKLRHYGWRDD